MNTNENKDVKARTWGCPVHQVGQSDLTYSDYLKVQELTQLQFPQSQPPHHDELLFIIIHQSYELWFKQILHEMESVITLLDQGELLESHHLMIRVASIMKLLVQQIHILETMRPIDFLEFRDRLNPASGFQSHQFREVEFLAGAKDAQYLEYFQYRKDILEKLKVRMHGPDLWNAFCKRLAREMRLETSESGIQGMDQQSWVKALVPVYNQPRDHLELYLLCESMVEFDQNLLFWRRHHVQVVERIIGFKPGTGGSEGVAYLKTTLDKKCFPALWAVRTELSKKGSSQEARRESTEGTP